MYRYVGILNMVNINYIVLIILNYIYLSPNNPWSNVNFSYNIYILGGLVIGPPPPLFLLNIIIFLLLLIIILNIIRVLPLDIIILNIIILHRIFCNILLLYLVFRNISYYFFYPLPQYNYPQYYYFIPSQYRHPPPHYPPHHHPPPYLPQHHPPPLHFPDLIAWIFRTTSFSPFIVFDLTWGYVGGFWLGWQNAIPIPRPVSRPVPRPKTFPELWFWYYIYIPYVSDFVTAGQGVISMWFNFKFYLWKSSTCL